MNSLRRLFGRGPSPQAEKAKIDTPARKPKKNPIYESPPSSSDESDSHSSPSKRSRHRNRPSRQTSRRSHRTGHERRMLEQLETLSRAIESNMRTTLAGQNRLLHLVAQLRAEIDVGRDRDSPPPALTPVPSAAQPHTPNPPAASTPSVPPSAFPPPPNVPRRASQFTQPPGPPANLSPAVSFKPKNNNLRPIDARGPFDLPYPPDME